VVGISFVGNEWPRVTTVVIVIMNVTKIITDKLCKLKVTEELSVSSADLS
jgi:uncharacterized membrane protein